MKGRRISRVTGRALTFADAHSRGLDIKRSFMALEPYAINDYVFKENLASVVGAKDVSEINKKIGSLEFGEPAQIVASLQAQLSRLEQRYLLEGLDMCEVIGRKIDQQELIQVLLFDISVFGYDKKLKESIMSVSAFAVNPNTDLTTCRPAMASIVPRKNVGENDFKDGMVDDWEEGPVELIPPTPPGARVNIIKSLENKVGECKLEFNISNSNKCVIDLKLVLFNFYNDLRKNFKEKNGGYDNGDWFEKVIRGEEPATTPDGKSCFKCNFGTFPFASPCKDKSEAHKKLRNCALCKSERHLFPICKIYRCNHARIAPVQGWRNLVFTEKVERIFIPRSQLGWTNNNGGNGGFRYQSRSYNSGGYYNNYGGSGRKRNRNEFERDSSRDNKNFIKSHENKSDKNKEKESK